MKKIITSLAMMSIVASPTLSLINNSQSSMNMNFNNKLQVKNNFKNPMGAKSLYSNIEGFADTGITVANNGDLYTEAMVGLYKSTDGINFESVPFFAKHDILCVYTDSQNNVYLVSDDGGLYESTDNCKTFTLLSMAFKNQLVDHIIKIGNNLLVSYSNPATKILKSTDNGKTFKTVLAPIGLLNGFFQSSSGVLIIKTNAYVYTSTDCTNFKTVAIDVGNAPISADFAPNGDFYITTKSIFSNTYELWDLTKASNYQTVNKVFSETSFSLLGNIAFNSNDSFYFVNRIDGKIYNINFKTGVFKILGSIINKQKYMVPTISFANGVVYVTDFSGITVFNTPYLLLNFGSDYTISADNTFQFNSTQNLGLKWNLLDSITVNGKAVASGTTNLNLTKGNYAISLKLKDQYKNIASDFSGDNNTGIVNYTFSITN